MDNGIKSGAGRLFARLAMSSALILGGSVAAAAQVEPMKIAVERPVPAPIVLTGVEPLQGMVNEVFGLARCDLVILNLDTTPWRPLSVGLPVSGAARWVDLRPYSLRSDRFAIYAQVEGGEMVPVKPEAERTLRGEVAGIEGSKCAGGVTEEGLHLRIMLADGSDVWVEPVNGRVPGAPVNLHVMYTVEDAVVGPVPPMCGGPEFRDRRRLAQAEAEPAAGGIGHRGAILYTAVMDTDADFEYFQAYGGANAVVNRIAIVTNTVNLQYERDVNITHLLGTQIVRASVVDPYSTTNPETFNAQIEFEWDNNRPGISDVIQVFTGKDLDGTVVGRANDIATICLDGDSNCVCQSDYNGLFMSATDLSAHELGHLWAATHCTCLSPPSTMNPNLTSINRFTLSNTPDNIAQIVGYRNERVCLTTSFPGTAAPNDNCADAVRIDVGTFGFDNNNATTDGPAVGGCGTGAQIAEDVWYTYTPPCTGSVNVGTCGSSFDTVVVVYSGSCGALTQIGCNDDNGVCGTGSLLNVPVTFGMTYWIRVGGYLGANGPGVLTISFPTICPVQPNDACANAILVSQCMDTPFSTVGATTDGPSEPANCNFFDNPQIGSDIWYRHVSPCFGTVRVSTCGSSYDTELAVYPTCPGPTMNTAIVCNDDNGPACSGTSASVQFLAGPGDDFWIRVGGFNNAQGTGLLTIRNMACPVPFNDVCGQEITVATGATAFDTEGACSQPFPSVLCANDGGDIPSDEWYRWTAPACGGNVTVDLCNANYDSKVAVYSDCPFGMSNPILACNDDACGGSGRASRLTFAAAPLATYRIRIGGYQGQTGSGTLTISVAPPTAPGNDVCTSAADVSAGGTFNGSLCGANDNGTATCGAADASPDVWYVYNAACTGTVRMTTCGTHDGVYGVDQGNDSVLTVFSGGPACSGLSEVACNDDFFDGCGAADTGVQRDSVVDVNVTAGSRYYVRVATYGGATGRAFVLNVGPCVSGVGACCIGSSCMVTTPAACIGTNTAFAGSGTTCLPSNPIVPCCRGDHDQDGVINVPDIFAFLSSWFAGLASADADASGGAPSVPDIFAFLSAWFGGCS